MGAIDPLIGGLAFYAATQIKILKHNLENIGDSQNNKIIGYKEMANNFNTKTVYQKIIDCIQHHNAILE